MTPNPTSLSRAAALIHGMQPHHLDHLASLAAELDIPLIVTKEEMKHLAKKYYPMTTSLLLDELHLGEAIIHNYDLLFSSLPYDLINHIFFLAQELYQKKLTFIWCPHGNSDKGHASYLMEGLHKERIALVYGKKMIDFLKKKKAYNQLDAAIPIGNFRFFFYRKHAPFYDTLVNQEVLSKLPPSSITLFYAPTWQDSEHSSSFFTAFPHLIENLPSHWNLIVKPHPNLLLQKPHETERLLKEVLDRPNILLLEDFPPIYPLLNMIDIYLGDMSSIGYDCLTFNKPLFFLNQNGRNSQTDPGLFLFRCGHIIERFEYNRLSSLIEQKLPHDQQWFQKIRREIYDYIFGNEPLKRNLKTTIIRTLHALKYPANSP